MSREVPEFQFPMRLGRIQREALIRFEKSRFRVGALTFRRTSGETGDVIVDEEGVGDGDRN